MPLAHFSCGGRFVMSNNLEGQESKLLCPPNSVGQRNLFLQWYLILCLKFLHVALVELEGAIFGSLHVVRYHSLGICQALGWPGQIFLYLCGYQ